MRLFWKRREKEYCQTAEVSILAFENSLLNLKIRSPFHHKKCKRNLKDTFGDKKAFHLLI